MSAHGPPLTMKLSVRAMALAVVIMAVFGGSFTMMKLGLKDLPLFALLALRLAVTCITLALVMRYLNIPFSYRGQAARFCVAQSVVFSIQQVFFGLGLALTTAGRGAILFNTQPFFSMLLLPLFVPAERFDLRSLAGTMLAFSGVVLVLHDPAAPTGALLGDIMMLAAAVMWAGNVLLNRTSPRTLHPVAIIFWSCAACTLVMMVASLFVDGERTWNLTPMALLSVLYLGLLGGALGFVAFVWLTQTYSPTRVNPFVFLSPIFGVLFGWLFLSEELGWKQAAGLAAVAGGIWIVNARTPRTASAPT